MPVSCIRIAILCCAMLAIPTTAHADILAGRIGAAGSVQPTIISAFRDAETGDVAPFGWLGGSNTQIASANRMTFDPAERTLLIADFYGQKVWVFAANARGDVAPLRFFDHPLMGQVREVVPIPAHNEYATLNFYALVYFSQSASGTVSPLRATSYQPTVINNASGLIYLEGSDEVAVGDYAELGGGQSEGEVLFFARSDSGAAVPTRRIAGSNTQLGQYVSGLSHDAVRGEIHVLSTSYIDGVPIDRVVSFSELAEGNAAPLRVIGGAATGLTASSSLSYYAFGDELLVTTESFGGAGTPSVIGFPRNANGNVAPTRRIGGSQSGVPLGDGWYSVVGLPLELIFAQGFEN